MQSINRPTTPPLNTSTLEPEVVSNTPTGAQPFPSNRIPTQSLETAQMRGQHEITTPTREKLINHVHQLPAGAMPKPLQQGAAQPPVGEPRIHVAMPGGGSIVYKQSDFQGLLQSTPADQRTAQFKAMSAPIAQRLKRGQQILSEALAGTRLQPTIQDTADVMLLLDAKARFHGQAFIEGAFSIEDPDGKLAQFFESSPEKYLRSSSHMSSDQQCSVDGHRNIHRGIDIPTGPTGLPYEKSTVLFATIPAKDGAGRRLYLKMENHGCFLNTLKARARQAGADTRYAQVRTFQERDRKEFWGHVRDFLATRGKGSAENSRKERIPSAIAKAFKKFTKKQFFHLSREQRALLKNNNPLDTSQGIKTILKNIQTCYQTLRPEQKAHFQEMLTPLISSMASKLAAVDNLDARVGNEVMFDTAMLRQLHPNGRENHPRPAAPTLQEKRTALYAALGIPEPAQPVA